MAAGIFDIDIEQGSDYDRLLQLTTQGTNPQPLVLTGYSARAQVRPNRGRDTVVLYELTSDGGGLAIDGPAGHITVTIPGEDSSAWLWTEAVYDLEIVSPDGKVTRLLKGAFRVDPEVTR
ncbi:hypothetical protein [Streptosporangium sp. LJ11]|uniref:hypothetical protein n=1 Tax=Streptosporangium sp. LJ11 TaxID=3436927 RepID=UPI003F7A9910